jgi:Predicted metal-binding, possibly nucleic acid-binding protein
LASQRYPLKINVGFLQHEPIGSYRDIHFEFPELQLPPDFEVHNLAGGVHISRTPQGLLVEGEFEAVTQLECVRCLEPYDQKLKTNFSEIYAYKNTEFTESGLVVPDDGNIDLAPIVREYLLLEFPIKPLCKPDCQGLCTVCGENLNLKTCEHQAKITLE